MVLYAAHMLDRRARRWSPSPRARALALAALLMALVAIAGSVLPVPLVALAPGPVTDTLGTADGAPLISVSGRPTYPTRGRLDLTTVAVHGGPGDALGLGEALRGWVDPTIAVVPERAVFPRGRSVEQVRADNARQMRESQDHATAAALRELGIAVPTYVLVDSVDERGPAAGQLAADDRIRAVAGQAVGTLAQLRQRLAELRPGVRATLTVVRAGATREVSVVPRPAPDDPRRAQLGVVVRTGYEFPFRVRIRLEDVGGPSAGLMFALGVVDKLTPGALTGGRHIAGTGDIDDAGRVGPIGGIGQKLVGARRAGASVFLVPAGNCSEARSARPDGLRLVKVSTLGSAVDALDALAAQRPEVPSC